MTELAAAVRVDLDELVDALVDEQRRLRALVRTHEPPLDAPTPADGWDVGDQLAHLAHGDRLAALALQDPRAFRDEVDALFSTADLAAAVDAEMRHWRDRGRDDLLDAWEDELDDLLDALRPRDTGDRVAWIAGEMSVTSFVRARLMEVFAHGQDVRDALGMPATATDHVAHVVHLGVRTRDFSYAIRGRTAPDVDIRLDLHAPSGERWTVGPAHAPERIEGAAVDLALVVTRRRHPDDTRLHITGPAAAEWMSIAQCYAGPPDDGRPAGAFPDGWRHRSAEVSA